MNRIPRIIPITDLRQDAAALLDGVQDSDDPCIITQRGRASAVLLSVKAYERCRRESELLRVLATGEREILEGRGQVVESVFREADRMLAAGAP